MTKGVQVSYAPVMGWEKDGNLNDLQCNAVPFRHVTCPQQGTSGSFADTGACLVGLGFLWTPLQTPTICKNLLGHAVGTWLIS